MSHNVSSKVPISLIQMGMSQSPNANLSVALSMITKAASSGAEIVCLPELFRSPYFCKQVKPSFEYAEDLSEVSQALSHSARQHKIVIVAGSVYEDSVEGKFNTSMVFDVDGSLVGKYRKSHIPHDPGFYEQNYFTPGNTGFVVFDTSKARLAVLICFDQWFPEAARAVALQGAEIIFYPTAIGCVADVLQEEGDWQSAWEDIQRGHAIANSVVIAAVNRVGQEDSTVFWGGSFICDAFGKVLSRGGTGEEIVSAIVDREHGKKVRESWGFMRNRRPELYSAICKKSSFDSLDK